MGVPDSSSPTEAGQPVLLKYGLAPKPMTRVDRVAQFLVREFLAAMLMS